MSGLPSVFAFLDHVDFLEAWLAAQRSAHRHWSVRRWLGDSVALQGPVLTNILKRRRIPQRETVSALIAHMRLDDDEGAFLHLLVDLARAPTLDRRMELLAEIYAHPRFRGARSLMPDEMSYLSSWVCVALRELSRLPGWDPTPTRLAARLQGGVAVAEIEAALLVLRRLGMLDASLGPVHAEIRVQTGPTAQSEAAMRYHRGLLDLAARCLTEVPWQERCYLAATLSVPATLTPRLSTELFTMLQQLGNLCDAEPSSDRRVMQINLQLFPLTRDAAPSEAPATPVDEAGPPLT
jgi:uncharacterized protein (TIGR02147 family)